MRHDICKLLGIEYPIFQGAMAGISKASLVAGVSAAGGLGIIAFGHSPGEVIRAEIKKVRELTDKPFGVNVMLLSHYVDEAVKVICEEKVAIVTTGAGNPAKYMEQFREAGVKVVPVVPSVAIAKKMEQLGVTAVVAEGMEAGGHIGKLTTMALVPQVVSSVSIPVVAAGGIADGRGFAACMMLGASGVQVGTRFLVAKECQIHENYKKAILDANDISTVITGSFAGHPVRVIRNKLAREMIKLDATRSEDFEESSKKLDELGAGGLQRAIDGEMSNSSIMSGQIAGLVSKEETCQEIIEDIMNDAREVMKRECSL